MKCIRLPLAEDTTAAHCGACPHALSVSAPADSTNNSGWACGVFKRGILPHPLTRDDFEELRTGVRYLLHRLPQCRASETYELSEAQIAALRGIHRGCWLPKNHQSAYGEPDEVILHRHLKVGSGFWLVDNPSARVPAIFRTFKHAADPSVICWANAAGESLPVGHVRPLLFWPLDKNCDRLSSAECMALLIDSLRGTP